jgi:hypothetical protein
VIFESGSRLERIEESAFYGSGLKSIEIPSSVIVLGRESLHECKALESVVLQNASLVEPIHRCSFLDSELESVAVGAALPLIDGSAFSNLSLQSLSIPHDHTRFRVCDSFLGNVSWRIIYRYFGACRSVVIPSSVVLLGALCFFDCGFLESVSFETGCRLERIQASAFSRSGLTSIGVPSSVIDIGESSFCRCTALASVLFESDSRLQWIEESAFRWSGLESIEIPSSVIVLGKASFLQCHSLESVLFKSGSRLERIEESAFHGSGLKSIEIPSSVIVLGKDSFRECWSLGSVMFESGSRLERIEASPFYGSGLQAIEIPSSVMFVDMSCFSGCTLLESVWGNISVEEALKGTCLTVSFHRSNQ